MVYCTAKINWCTPSLLWYYSVQFSCSIMSWRQFHGLPHARLPYPSPTPRACSNSCPSSRRWHLTISLSVVLFSSCLQSFPASGSFPMSQFSASSGQSIGASASTSVLPMTAIIIIIIYFTSTYNHIQCHQYHHHQCHCPHHCYDIKLSILFIFTHIFDFLSVLHYFINFLLLCDVSFL